MSTRECGNCFQGKSDMDNDLGWADRMLQMDKARKLIDATLAKIGAK